MAVLPHRTPDGPGVEPADEQRDAALERLDDWGQQRGSPMTTITLAEPIEAALLDETSMHALAAMIDFVAGHQVEVVRQGPPPLTDAEWERNLVGHYRERGWPADVVTIFRSTPTNTEAEDQSIETYATLNLPPLERDNT